MPKDTFQPQSKPTIQRAPSGRWARPANTSGATPSSVVDFKGVREPPRDNLKLQSWLNRKIPPRDHLLGEC